MRKLVLASLFVCFATSTALAVPEICGNGLDDSGDGRTDEGCYNLISGQCESPLSCSLTGSISPKMGSLRYALPPDLSPRVPWGPGIGLKRFYTSMYQPPGGAPVWKSPLGPRWQHTYMTWIDTVNSDIRVLHTNQGQDVQALRNGGVIDVWQYYTVQAGFHVDYLRQRTTAPSEYQMRLLSGEVLVYNSSGRLTEIWDVNHATLSNKVLIAYDGNGQVSTVTDAKGTRRLLFTYTTGLLTSVQFQILLTGSWTTQQTTGYTYASGQLATYTANAALVQTNVYTSGQLTQIQDATAKLIVAFDYATATAGQVVRVATPRGTVGFEYASTRANCSAKTVLYFNKGNAASCNVDADCGSGYLCGGKTASGVTGRCFRAARCMTVASPNEDVVTNVAPIGPPGETCDGACTEVAQYVWNTSGTLDLTAVQDPIGNYTVTRTFNSNGLPTKVTYGDADSDPNNGNSSREVYLFYGNTLSPGKVTEIRRKSDLDPNASLCSAASSTGCASTSYQYDDFGRMSSSTQSGTTVTASPLGGYLPYAYVTSYSYDSQHRVTQVDGPLAGSNDVTVFEYWSSASDLKDGFVQNYKRKKDTTNFVITSALDYTFWGYPTVLRGEDTDATHATGSITCLTFDAARGHLTQRREAMAGQADCSTTNAADLTTTWVRDSALRLTQITRPDGSCMFYEYDSRGRLLRTKRRDDCNAASSGDRQELVYDEEGLITEVQTYDAANVLTSRQPYSYFDSRKLEKVLNPVDTSKWTGITYDARGMISQVDGAGGIGKTVFHRDGVPGREARLTSVDKYKDASLFDTWNLLYTWLGDQLAVSDGDSKTTTTFRDDLGRVVSQQSPDHGPTILVYDEANRLVTKVEGIFTPQQQTHSFTYDNLGRPLNFDYSGTCPTGTPHAEIQNVYDAAPVACPVGMTCSRTGGRLAYVKVSLLCTSTQSGTDGSLDQETFYAYDDAGRLIREYVRDDAAAPRIADHLYAWTKAGGLSQVTLPSATVIGWTYGSAGSNSDTDLVSAVWRTNTSTPVANAITWFPYGPLKQYNQQNKIGNKLMRTRITRNLANRITGIFLEPQAGGAASFSVAITEDAKGRVTTRDYSAAASGVQDSFFLYDQQDRVICENATLVTTCPTSGTSLKNSHSSSFTHAGDWLFLRRPVPGSTNGFAHEFNPSGYPSTHQLTTVRQNDGTPAHGDTAFTYDGRGNRISDDNTSTLTNDRRDYTYDARGNISNVHGRYFTGGVWHDYDVASAFDAKNRRVFKSFLDNATGVQSQWFFYYDATDRMTEVRYTPNIAAPSTFTTFQMFWVGDRLVLYWQTDFPAATTTKRYVDTDEAQRPVEMWTWPASGNGTRVWAINPSAWGFDKNVVGSTVFQPLMFAGQYQDTETVAFLNDGATLHRPGVVLNGFRTYDPFTGAYLQVDPLAASTWDTYVYAGSNPVGKNDPTGLQSALNELTDTWRSSGLGGFGFGISFWGDCWDIGDIESMSACLDSGDDGWGGGGGGGGGGGTSDKNCPYWSCYPYTCDGPWFSCSQCQACAWECIRQSHVACDPPGGDEGPSGCHSLYYQECVRRPNGPNGTSAVSCARRCDCFDEGISRPREKCGTNGLSGLIGDDDTSTQDLRPYSLAEPMILTR